MQNRLKKILIADDDYSICKLLKRYYKKYNYFISTTKNGITAYQKLKTDNYDVCLLDINLPMKSGLEILKKVGKSSKLTTTIIVLTGNRERQTIIEVMNAGANNYIQKPFDLNELTIVIEKGIQLRIMKLENLKYKYYLENEIDKKTKEMKKAYIDTVNAFIHSIEMRDAYTGGHSGRVSKIAYRIAKDLLFNKTKLEEVRIGGILHDIGKIGISDRILQKPGKLTIEEYNEIKKHPQRGSEIIKDITFLKPILPYILHHHERFDGRGYPHGLKAKNIPLEGRILAVADAYEAMTSNRPYRKAMPIKKATNEILSNAGSQFDPEIVNIFKKLFLKKGTSYFI